MSESRLSDAAATLVSRLPADAQNLRSAELRAVIELQKEILAARERGIEHTQKIIALITARGGGPSTLPVDVLSSSELAEWEGITRMELDADRAGEALNSWRARSGLDQLAEKVTGEPSSPPPAREPLLMEEPDGSITINVRNDD